jgi:hypothetical protein
MPSKTRFTLLHASRSPMDLPPPAILGPLTSIAQGDPSRLRLKLFVDDKASSSDHPYDLNVGRIDRKAVEDVLEIRRPSMWDKLLLRKFDPRGVVGEGRKVLFLVCGPDQWVSQLSADHELTAETQNDLSHCWSLGAELLTRVYRRCTWSVGIWVGSSQEIIDWNTRDATIHYLNPNPRTRQIALRSRRVRLFLHTISKRCLRIFTKSLSSENSSHRISNQS